MLRALSISTMRFMYTLPEDFPTPHSAIRDSLHGSWNRRSSGVAIGLCGGFVALIAGSILTLISWFIDPKWHGVFLHQTSTFLFVLALPLLIIGAHCLDLIDKDKKLVDAADATAVGKGQDTE